MAKVNSSALSSVVERLSHSEEHFRLLVESVQDYALFMLDPAGRVASWNPGAQRMTGYRSGEIVGRHFSRFYLREDIDAGKPDMALEQAAATGRFEDEGRRVRKDGSHFRAGTVITAIRDESGRLRGYGKVTHDLTGSESAMQRLNESEARFEACMRHGSSLMFVRNLDGRYRYANGQFRHAFGPEPNTDCAARSNGGQRVDQTGNDREVDALALMLSRDLRPALRNIETLASQVKEGMAELSAMAGRLDLIAKSAVGLTKLTNDLLMFSRSGRLNQANYRTTDLNPMVADACRALGTAAQLRRIEWNIGKLPLVAGDPALLKAVFEQMLSNAVKFTRPREPAVIEVASIAADGDEVVIEIRDNGVGFGEQYAHRLFGAFQRLHGDSRFEGAGIGLAIAKRIVECHGGRVWASSRPGEGASFFFTLQPAAMVLKNTGGDNSSPPA